MRVNQHNFIVSPYKEIQKADKESQRIAIVGTILTMIAIVLFFFALFSFAGLLHNLIIN